MDGLRRFLWLWVLGGVLLASLLISLVFILINRCISRAGKQEISQLRRRSLFKTESNKYEARAPDTPPLPPRPDFLAETQSYENLAQVPEDQHGADTQPDYVKVEQEAELQPAAPLYQRPHAVASVQSYENLAEEHDYEESTADWQEPDQQPDYVRVEEEAEEVEEVEAEEVEAGGEEEEEEDYDDIGAEDDEDDEDYDDVG